MVGNRGDDPRPFAFIFHCLRCRPRWIHHRFVVLDHPLRIAGPLDARHRPPDQTVGHSRRLRRHLFDTKSDRHRGLGWRNPLVGPTIGVNPQCLSRSVGGILADMGDLRRRVSASIATAKKAGLLKAVALISIGILLGATLAMLRIGKAMDRMTLDNAALIDEVERLSGELASRERALTAARGVPVRSIEIEIESTLPEHVRLHVESETRDLLQNLLGEEVDSLSPILIEKALERVIRVDKQELYIQPTRLLLGSKILVRLRVSEN